MSKRIRVAILAVALVAPALILRGQPAAFAQGTIDKALGSPASSKVGAAPPPAPSVNPSETTPGPAVVPDMSVGDADCGSYYRPPTPEQKAGCRLYADWFNTLQRESSSNQMASPGAMIQSGKVLVLGFHTVFPPPERTFNFTLPLNGLATPGTDKGDIKGHSYYVLSYVNDGKAITLEATVTPYDGEVRTQHYNVVPGQPLKIDMGFGDYITVDTELRDPTPSEVRVDCQRTAGARFYAATPRPTSNENQAMANWDMARVTAARTQCP